MTYTEKLRQSIFLKKGDNFLFFFILSLRLSLFSSFISICLPEAQKFLFYFVSLSSSFACVPFFLVCFVSHFSIDLCKLKWQRKVFFSRDILLLRITAHTHTHAYETTSNKTIKKEGPFVIVAGCVHYFARKKYLLFHSRHSRSVSVLPRCGGSVYTIGRFVLLFSELSVVLLFLTKSNERYCEYACLLCTALSMIRVGNKYNFCQKHNTQTMVWKRFKEDNVQRLLIVFVIQFEQECKRKKNRLGSYLFDLKNCDNASKRWIQFSHFTCSNAMLLPFFFQCLLLYRLISICVEQKSSPWCACARIHAHTRIVKEECLWHKKVSPRSFPTLMALNKNESNELESDSFKWNYTYLYEFQSGEQNMDFFYSLCRRRRIVVVASTFAVILCANSVAHTHIPTRIWNWRQHNTTQRNEKYFNKVEKKIWSKKIHIPLFWKPYNH